STARTARRSRPVRDWPRAPLAARRCSLKRSAVVGAASRSFAETAGLGLGRLAWKCCATCFLTKPTIAGRCVCSRISSDSRCRTRWGTGSGIGKSYGKSAGRLAAPATILKESLKGAGPGMGCDGGDIEPPPLSILNVINRQASDQSSVVELQLLQELRRCTSQSLLVKKTADDDSRVTWWQNSSERTETEGHYHCNLT